MIFLVDNESTLGSQFLPFLRGIIAIRKKKHSIWLWWKKHEQSTHWIQVKQMYGILPQK